MTRRWARTSWTLRWVGLAAAATLLGVLMASRWWWVYWYGTGPQRSAAFVARGAVIVEWYEQQAQLTVFRIGERPGWSLRPVRQRPIPVMAWRPTYERLNVYGSSVATIPLWMPLVLVVIPTALAWSRRFRARKRARVGSCASCGYDMAGVAMGVCPECGAAFVCPVPPRG